jgi:hypothetical protein
MNNTEEALVDDYLRRLEAAANALPPQRRAELVLEIKGHIDEAMATASVPTDEAWTRTLLERLGSPEEIVSSEGGGPAASGIQMVERPAGTGLELAAVLLLTVGSLIPFVGWIAGVICLWASKRWRTWEKLLGTLIVPGGPLSLLWISVFWLPTQVCQTSSSSSAASGPAADTTTSCTGFAFAPAVGIPLFVFVVVAPIVVAGWLYSRARARAALEPPTIVVVGARQRGIRDSAWGTHELAAVFLLAAGALLLPVVGPLVGMVLVWTSREWTHREKWIATAIASGGIVLPVLLVALFAAS